MHQNILLLKDSIFSIKSLLFSVHGLDWITTTADSILGFVSSLKYKNVLLTSL